MIEQHLSYPPRILMLTVALLLDIVFCPAQGLINQTTLYVSDGLEVHIDGEVNNSGFLQNQGTMLVSGNWTNTNVYQGLGTISLKGSQLQQFKNNDNSIFNLVVTGGGAKQMIGNNTVKTSLFLNDGVVIVSASDKFTLEDGVTLTGGSPNSYVYGALSHVGSGYKFFPIGKNGGYYPVELLDVTGAGVTTEMEVLENASTLTLPSTYKLFSDVYWQRRTIAGTFLNSPISLGYSIPDGYTDNHTLEILQSANNTAFTPLGDISVDFQSGIDKITTTGSATASLFVIGESTSPDNTPSTGPFYLPTSLSPSAGDPRNRIIKVYGDELQEENFHFIVFNRWGLKVFESVSLQEMSEKGWDGLQDKGNEYLPTGSYPFILKATNRAGDPVEKKGAIAVIR